MFIKNFSGIFSSVYKVAVLKEQIVFVKVKVNMRKKSKAFISGNYYQDLFEDKENMEEIVVLEKTKKHISKGSSSKKLLKSKVDTSTMKRKEKIEGLEENKQNAGTSQDVVAKKEITSNSCDDGSKIGKALRSAKTIKKAMVPRDCNDAVNISKSLRAKAIKRPLILSDSTKIAKFELKKKDFSEITSNQSENYDSYKLKEAVVMLEKYEGIGKKNICSLSYEDVKKSKKAHNKSKNCLPKCECHSSFLMKEAVVVLDRYEDIQKIVSSSKTCDSSDIMLEDVVNAKKAFNKSGKGTKRKKENENKSQSEDDLECKKQKGVVLENSRKVKKASTKSGKSVVLKQNEESKTENEDISESKKKKDIMLEDGEKVMMAANKSGKGTKRKKEEKSKSESEDGTNSKKQKDSGPSKSSKKEKIPDVSALDFNNESKSPSGNLWNFKISSWNINGIRAWLEKNGISYLHHEQPDILCIQETKCSDDKLPNELKTIEGYHAYWLSGDKEGYSGVGLLSKEKPIKVEYGIGISDHDNEGRVITAEYDKFYLVSTYVPNAGRGLVRLDYRMKWDKDFRDYLKKLDAEKPVILCGDLNVAHEEIDLANPKTNKKNAGFTKEEREGFSTLLKEGFIDTFRQLYPDVKGAYTFWTYMMNARAKNVGWRLDYFVISERFTENLCDNVIRKDVLGSDHCPITLFLSL